MKKWHRRLEKDFLHIVNRAMLTVPNILTLSRIVLLVPLIALLFIQESWAAWTAFALYVIAVITDFLDGYMARSMKLVSAFGKFLDPTSDKIFVTSLLSVLVGIGRLPDLWMIPVIIILTREFMISGLREFLGPKDIQIPVSRLAKWKTTLQMFAIGFLVVGPYGDVVLPGSLQIGQWGLVLAAVLTVITGWDYLKSSIKHFKS